MNAHIYRELLEDSPIPYLFMKLVRGKDKECIQIRILDMNKSFEQLFKISREQIVKLDIKEHLNIDEYHRLLNNLKRADMSQDNKHSVFRYFEVEDNIFNTEIYTFKQDEYHIRMTKVNRYNHNISKAIRQSPFATWVKDRDGRYIDVNDEYLKIFKLQYHEVVGRSAKEVWKEEKANIFAKLDLRVMQENRIHRQIDILRINDFKECYFEVVRWPYTDESGTTILGTIGIAVEITDKVKVREAIEKNEQNFYDMANNIDELIVIRNEKRALYISPYFEELYGFKPDALYEDMDNWYKHWDHIEFLTEPQVYSYSEIDTSIFRVVKNGQVDKWIQSKFIPIFDEHGNILRKIGILRDITDKKKVEEEIECLRMEFFVNISHELRTPINIIMSALQMINLKVQTLDQKVIDNLNKYLDIMSQNGLRLIKLVNNLIDTTKINSGNFDYKATNQDLISFIEDICMSVVEFVERNHLEIIFDTDVEEKIVAFDRDQIERIVLNLISNAIKFNQENGKIEVSICTEDQIRISIKDTGIGIPKDKQESIFRRFEQVDKTCKREKEGSGIGLALVKSLVEMHGGTIQVVSVLGKGSEFIITLPDVLVPEETGGIDKSNYYVRQEHKLKVEFSDIYC